MNLTWKVITASHYALSISASSCLAFHAAAKQVSLRFAVFSSLHFPDPNIQDSCFEISGRSTCKIFKLCQDDFEYFPVILQDPKFAALLRQGKILGFCDAQLEKLCNGKYSEIEIRAMRKQLGIVPVVKKIDTTAAEFPSETNYLYLTYLGDSSEV